MPPPPDTREDASGSRTMTIEATQQPESGPSEPHHRALDSNHTVGVLKLRGAPVRKQRVMWTDETVDNEGMGKKKSKICCIYHRPKAYDESSTESDSSCSEGESHSHQRRQRTSGKQASRRKRRDVVEVEQSTSSESEGGHGDGRAKSSKRSPRRHHAHDHGDHDHPSHSHKPNKYDHQEKPSSSDAIKG
ncbi:phosphatase inhibitor-domain-containing protein [Kockovaella imperatae]|uniref:Type 1 phosphatases regulator n=1 Tax=Kockovaella imperatae TaxID=4999 RepID=A0A1Y1UCM1_9TREE|nr:phosphatase inhibitor-domain-containing protein [Kockovaella imperatae]ORX35793.1 phosphatase inhibitor-domain-containing protein [Kockovaella imperatae]